MQKIGEHEDVEGSAEADFERRRPVQDHDLQRCVRDLRTLLLISGSVERRRVRSGSSVASHGRKSASAAGVSLAAAPCPAILWCRRRRWQLVGNVVDSDDLP